MWKYLIQSPILWEIEEALSDPKTEGGEELLSPLFRKVRVCSNLAWQLGDFTKLELLNAIV